MQTLNTVTARALLLTPGKAVLITYHALLNLLPFALETGDALAS